MLKQFDAFKELSTISLRLSDVMEPIRRLTHQEVRWEWTDEQETAMTEIKQLLTKTPVLRYYDPLEELHIECDASSKGLGTGLLQQGRPLAYASRALSDTECGYAQIEKECLAIVFALETFHQYSFRRPTIVHSDHKPLEAILWKPLYKAPKRLQSMMLRLLQYNIDVVYRPGKQMYLSDMLSREYINSITSSSKPDTLSAVNAVGHLRVSPEKLEELRNATREDETINILKSVILRGWPENKKELPESLAPYCSARDEFTVHDGLVFKGERIVVPENMRTQVKSLLHSSHLGKESMLRRARECVYRPGMTDQIKQITESCEACQT